MNKYFKTIILASTASLLTGAMALAAITYSANITVVNTGSTSYDMLASNVTANVEYMAVNIFNDSEGLDTRVLQGISAQKHMLADDRIMFTTPLSGTTSKTLTFSTHNSLLPSFPVIVGFSNNSTVGYVEVPDAANIELGDNFTTSQEGWIDTDNASGKNLIFKSSAFRTYVSPVVSGNITSAIYLPTANASPTGFIDAGAGWSTETNAFDGNLATFTDT